MSRFFYKESLSVAVIALMMLTALPANAASLWSDPENYDVSWYTPDAETYEINSAKQLAGLAQLVNEKGIQFVQKTINLTGDIDLSEHVWIPIGGRGKIVYEGMIMESSFSGNFNGNGHTISGMRIDNSALTSETNNYLGLFGSAQFGYYGAEIYNLKLKNATITIESAPKNIEYIEAGALVADAGTSIHDVEVEATIELSPSKLGCSVTAGGIAGSGSVENSHFSGSVVAQTDNNSHIGGITGSGNVSHCTNDGEVKMLGVFAYVGGLIGKGDAEGCVNRGKITVIGSGSEADAYGFSTYIGGITAEGKAMNCANYGDIDSNLYAYIFGSNGIIIGSLAAAGEIGNSHNHGSITSVAYNAGMEIISNLKPWAFDTPDYSENSYSLVHGSGEGEYVADYTSEKKSDTFMKSAEFLEMLNNKALEVSKSRKYIPQDWIAGDDGLPVLSGKYLYPLTIEASWPSRAEGEYGSSTIIGTWEDYSVQVGKVHINGECFYADDNVEVEATPMDGFVFERAELSYYDGEEHCIYFNAEDAPDNKFSFKMPAHSCRISFKFSAGAGVEDVTIEDNDVKSVYSLDGNLIYCGDPEDAHLEKGIYIVKSGKTVRKVFVK